MSTTPSAPLTERFLAKVDKRGPDECWNWTGALNGRDYGRIAAGNAATKRLSAHRLSYEMHHGPIPDIDGKPGCVLHRCDNPKCVNPAHLFLGTLRDNVLDMWAKGRAFTPPIQAANRAKATCANGHPFDEHNTREKRLAGRVIGRRCRECARQRSTITNARVRGQQVAA